ncbi:vWA domain-containing protein [Mameliella sediminis]|uniref:vWA domain-containing protein n=1 Tax=Mameliella sediminis TaxID=2836866 RepID=UPI001C46F94C|nr:VWA domain-containing protein [Mameliella sediminis]MBV7392910.1 VWA domain-containing protein [Mameliella sediminis]
MTRFRRAALALSLLPGLAVAQESSQSILVLDASGSMWGQIDGLTKIEIAQGVVGDLLRTLPDTQTIGLTAYGHRTKGDCTDIETLIAPGAASRGDIAAAVNKLRPRGKTPMTDAVIVAAKALKYTEEPATVILVSDGVETCNPDPCAAARALEQAGVDLTVHVVGFDVDDPEARRQMQCLADETGGQFLLAANASELGQALTEVTQAQPAATYGTRFVAQDGPDGGAIETPLVWDLRRGDELIVDFQRVPNLDVDLTAGTYTVSVLRPSDEASVEKTFDVVDGDQTVTLILPSSLPDASVSGPGSAVAGATVPIAWEGPNAQGDYIAISKPDDNGYVNYVYTREANPAGLVMPPEPGEYELRYILSDGRKTLAKQAITVTPLDITLDADDTVIAGAPVPVSWDGPNYQGDYIGVQKRGEKGYINYTYTREGSPLNVVMPPEPGEYELRYFLGQRNTPMASRPITVTAVDITLDADEAAMAGAPLPVTWQGPDYQGDYIGVQKLGEKGYINYTYTREGSPLNVVMPTEPGEYELRYFLGQRNTLMASRRVTVTDVAATLAAPDTAAAGAPLTVEWTGPDYQGDYIAVGIPGERYISYTYTREGSPLQVTMPAEPGTYELRYTLGQRNTVVVTKPIEVTEVSASLTAPEQARAGASILVEWDGPGYQPDYISVAEPGMPENKYIHYTYTREGTPLLLRLPNEPGTYELRYVAASKGASVIGTRQITLTEVEASIDAPDKVPAGGVLGLNWDGPDFKGDYISLARVGEPDNKHSLYKYTGEDSPMVLKMPEGPGKYELRYVIGQGNRVIFRKPIELTYEPE